MSKKVFMWSIIAGLIASILLSYVLEPFSIWLWRLLSDSASSWALDIQNSAIQNAAMGIRPWVSAVSFVATINTIAWLFLALSTLFVVRSIVIKSNGKPNTESEATRDRTKFMRFLPYIGIVNALFFIYFSLKISFLVYVDLQMNASFSQRMMAIKPYITQKQHDILYSSWALMSSPEDYKNINSQIDKFGEVADIKLPTVMYK
ncbi:hypothetical protein [Vibrio rotiferianus]|uniref:hypothetical protein n=1 Tax=Vibrio rotiferianus TaxID=190895 RepID=UPI0005EDE4DB|nr:hypothetical protein [Vibrio rotiferianus]